MGTKPKSKKKSPTIKRVNAIGKKDYSLLQTMEALKINNALRTLHNETLGPLTRDMRYKTLTGLVTQEDIQSFKKKRTKFIKDLDKASQKLIGASPLVKYQKEVLKFRVSDAVLATRSDTPSLTIEKVLRIFSSGKPAKSGKEKATRRGG